MDCLVTDAATAATKTVKQHDTHPVRWQIPGFNLTGCEVRVLIKRDTTVTELSAEIVEPPTAGLIEHKLTGELAPGSYQVEIEITETASGDITTVPTEDYGTLRVIADLG